MAKERFSDVQRLRKVLEQLRDVRITLNSYGLAPRTVPKVSAAIKSLEGAIRHAEGLKVRRDCAAAIADVLAEHRKGEPFPTPLAT